MVKIGVGLLNNSESAKRIKKDEQSQQRLALNSKKCDSVEFSNELKKYLNINNKILKEVEEPTNDRRLNELRNSIASGINTIDCNKLAEDMIS